MDYTKVSVNSRRFIFKNPALFVRQLLDTSAMRSCRYAALRKASAASGARCHGNGRARGALGTAAAAENKHESDASRTCCGARGQAARALRGCASGDVCNYRFRFHRRRIGIFRWIFCIPEGHILVFESFSKSLALI